MVYRTAERQKEQQKAEMMRESSDSVDNDTVQTLYQGSYVLYVEQMERSGQADAGGLFLNLPTDDEDYQYVKDTVTSTFDEWKSQFESDSWNIGLLCIQKQCRLREKYGSAARDMRGWNRDGEDKAVLYGHRMLIL